MVSFNNTEIAFADKSNNDLKKAFWLFKIISFSTLVKAGNQLLYLCIKLHLPVKKIIKATIFKQFCGGENLEECDKKIKLLGQSNIGTILDYSVEGKETEADFDYCREELLLNIHKAQLQKNIPFCVFKVTGLARFGLLEKVSAGQPLNRKETEEFKKIEERINTICKTAHESGVPVFMDAEESWIQPAIDRIARKMMEQYNKGKSIIYNTYQMYRKDRLSYLKLEFETAQQEHYYLGAKIVRGAYMEKERERALKNNYPSPIHDNKKNTDNDYNEALSFCLDNINSIGFCAASHNEDSLMQLAQMIEKGSIPKNNQHIYFAQLLGMSDHITYNLAKAGYNVAKYVPYGPVQEVLPYLVRRAQENTFVKGQTGRELSLIMKEIKRRKTK